MSETGRSDGQEERGRTTDERSHMVTVGAAALCGRLRAPPVATEFGGSGGCAPTGVACGARAIYSELGDGRGAVPGPRRGRADQKPSKMKIPYPLGRATSRERSSRSVI